MTLDIDRLATRVVLHYFQTWGQTEEEGLRVLSELLYAVSLSFALDEERTQQFLKELAQCWPLGRFEHEVEAVSALIRKWRKP